MHKVTRLPEPNSLVRNHTNWTQALIAEIQRVGSYTKVDDNLKNKYKQNDVKEQLVTMYQGLCCYCESRIGVVTHEHIEHMKPKSIFPTYSFNWNNLHLSCPRCNNNKLDKWDPNNPIIDPTVDDPTDELDFRFHLVIAKTLRGLTTINHVKLNRKELEDARLAISGRIMKMIETMSTQSSFTEKQLLIDELTALTEDGSEYSSLVKSLVQKYLTAV